MKTNNGYLTDDFGNRSSSRRNTTVIIMVSLFLACVIVIASVFDENASLIQAATAAGMLFVMISGPALAYMYNQKLTELKKFQTMKDEKDN